MCFSNIQSVHVERKFGADNNANKEDALPERNEYWQPEKGEAASAISRQKRWETVNYTD
jgi:hypothetical protein